MAKITREPQKIFGGSLLATDNIAVFGSTKAGTPTYSLDPSTIQSTAFLSGWGASLVNNRAPTVQEMNGVFYVATYQLAYLMQTGVPEWDSATTYYTGSIVSNGGNTLYASLANDNTNQALTDSTKWRPIVQNGTVAATGPTATLNCQDGCVFNVAVGTGGNKTLTITKMHDGQTINVLVNGLAGNTVTWTLTGAKAEDAGALTEVTGVTYSNTMTSGQSLFTLTRIGSVCVINSLHGIA